MSMRRRSLFLLTPLAMALATLSATPAWSAPSGSPSGTSATVPRAYYAINLESAITPVDLSRREPLDLGPYQLYSMQIEISGQLWHRVRVGVFETKSEANAVLKKLKRSYPGAWIARVDQDEARKALTKMKVTQTAAPAPISKPAPPPPAEAVHPNTAGGTTELMQQAREAMLVNDYTRAIQLYTKLVELGGQPYAREAQELLGLARERNGQFAHAKAEYELYLRQWPEGEDAKRVRQRLLGLITARAETPQPLREAQAAEGSHHWEGYGSIYGYLRWDESSVGGINTRYASTVTDLDYTARRRGQVYDVRTRFNGQYFMDLNQGDASEGEINTLYVEALHSGNGLSAIIGRQSRSTGGMLGRFDGAVLSKPLNPRIKVHAAAGLPVEFETGNRLNTSKQFYSLALDLNLGGPWDFTGWYMQQQVAGISDRQAIGGEARYFNDNRSLFGLLDYDVSYQSLNTALALASWNKPDGTTFNVILDYRKTPTLATSNALISQATTSMETLLEQKSESEVRQLARDRTALSRSVTVSATRPLTDKLQVSADVTVSSITGTPESGGVAATEGTGQELYYAAQLIANDLLGKDETTLFGVRYSDTRDADTTSFSVNTRYPVDDRLSFNPALRLDLRRDRLGEQRTLAAGLRVNHRLQNDLHLEAELGADWTDRRQPTGDERYSNHFVFLGIRKDF